MTSLTIRLTLLTGALTLAACQDATAPAPARTEASTKKSSSAELGALPPMTLGAPVPGDTVGTGLSVPKPSLAVVTGSTGIYGLSGHVNIPQGAALCSTGAMWVSGMRATLIDALFTDTTIRAEVYLMRWTSSGWSQYGAPRVVDQYVGTNFWYYTMPDVIWTDLPSGHYNVRVRFSWWTYGVKTAVKTFDFNSMYDYAPLVDATRGAGWCYLH
jgi:hypothetical protein